MRLQITKIIGRNISSGVATIYRLCLIFVVLSIAVPVSSFAQKKSTCISCHLEEIDEDQTTIVENFLVGVHAKRGIGCEGCHGGDPNEEDATDAMDEDIGFIGVPERYQIPAMCATCHADPNYMRGYNPNIPTDQYPKYLISGHGKRLTKDHDPKVATCINCHGVHGILAPNDPLSPVYALNIPYTCSKCHSDSVYMAGRDIPTDQFKLYATSVHGRALLERGDRAAPTCTGCHGSHEARRPDPSGVANTCAQCHNYNRELFVASPHKAAHEEHNYPECEVCHGNHAIMETSDDMLLSDDKGVCQKCHDEGSNGLVAAIAMKSSIDSLKMVMHSARELIELVRNYGMNTEEPEYQLRQAHNKLVGARALIHAFAPDSVSKSTNEGIKMAGMAEVQGEELLEQYNFRRKGFILSVLVIFFLSFLLTKKIRSLE